MPAAVMQLENRLQLEARRQTDRQRQGRKPKKGNRETEKQRAEIIEQLEKPKRKRKHAINARQARKAYK